MPPKVSTAVARSAFNLSSVLQALPSTTSTPQVFTKCSTCLFSTTAQQKASTRRHTDPYRTAQARQRKTANQARQATLQEQRKASLGDPVRSRPTPFIQSFKSPSSYAPSSDTPAPTASQEYLNFFLKPADVTTQIAHSKWLTEPIPLSEKTNYVPDSEEAETDEQRYNEFIQAHENAERALQSITDLNQGSSKDRTRLNVQRCIEEFGRHNTDTFLPPKPASAGSSSSSGELGNARGPQLSEEEAAAAAELATIPKRVGPDTGSSEVQAAILTAKINTLVENLGRKDKNNKRNLRLLVHRRQKHLAYLRRKERGGPRWQHLVEKLGINDAMWKGEISL